jgi:hypothetical protein
LRYTHEIGKKKVQLLFTIDPRPGGNITTEDLISVLQLSRRHKGTLISVNFFFNELSYSLGQILLLFWFKFQAGVQLSLGKLLFIVRGGNNIYDPTCDAVRDTVTVDPSGHIVLPCYHCGFTDTLFTGDLEETLASARRQELIPERRYKIANEGAGTYMFSAKCEGCTLWCYLVPSFTRHWQDRCLVWFHALSGIQWARDQLYKLLGLLHPRYRYPRFKPFNEHPLLCWLMTRI